MKRKPSGAPLLTLNCHEAWVHQLGYLNQPFHVIDGLSGRYTKSWDTHVRPVPKNATLITLPEALRRQKAYSCIIAHNLTDLLELKTLDAPRVLVLHTTIEGRMVQEGIKEFPVAYVAATIKYVALLNIHVVVVSELKARSWGFSHEIIPFGADPSVYPPWTGELAAGLRVANQVQLKAQVLKYDLHRAAFDGLPVRLVGFNPELPGVTPSESWDHLKQLLATHRFYVHTAHAEMEDGYNMAMLEAMAAGMPVLGNRHPSSPIEHGVNGFVSDDPAELRAHAQQLLDDRELARRLGQAARETVRTRFSMKLFASKFAHAIKLARAKWRGLPA